MWRAKLYEHWRADRVPDGQGGWSAVYAKIGDVRARLNLKFLTSRDRERADTQIGRKTEAVITYTGYTLAAYGVLRHDRLVGVDGVVYEVLSVRAKSGRDVELQVQVTQAGL